MIITDLRQVNKPDEVISHINECLPGTYSLIVGGIPKQLWKLSSLLQEANSDIEVRLVSLLTPDDLTGIESKMRQHETSILLGTPEELEEAMDVGHPDRIFLLRMPRRTKENSHGVTVAAD